MRINSVRAATRIQMRPPRPVQKQGLAPTASQDILKPQSGAPGNLSADIQLPAANQQNANSDIRTPANLAQNLTPDIRLAVNGNSQQRAELAGRKDAQNAATASHRGLADANRANVQQSVGARVELGRKFQQDVVQATTVRGENQEQTQWLNELRSTAAANVRGLADVARQEFQSGVVDQLQLGDQIAADIQQATTQRGQFQKEVVNLGQNRKDVSEQVRGQADVNRQNFQQNVQFQAESSQEFSENIVQTATAHTEVKREVQGLADLHNNEVQTARGQAELSLENFQKGKQVQANVAQKFAEDIRQTESLRSQFQEDLQGLTNLLNGSAASVGHMVGAASNHVEVDIHIKTEAGPAISEDIQIAYKLSGNSNHDTRIIDADSQSIWMV